MSMERIDEKIEEIKKLQAEIEHRKEVEHEVEELICQGRCEEAVRLLMTLDESDRLLNTLV